MGGFRHFDGCLPGRFAKPPTFGHASAVFFWAQKMSPCADVTVVAAREGDPVDLVDAEEANPAMFFADPKTTLVASVQAVSHDDHVSLWEHLVDPTVEERSDLDGDPELLVNFPSEAALRGLPGLQPPSREFPLAALILQQNDPAALIENALYRNGKHCRSNR
jgi:hypothetical protein